MEECSRGKESENRTGQRERLRRTYFLDTGFGSHHQEALKHKSHIKHDPVSKALEVVGYGSYGLTKGSSTEEGAVSWYLANTQQLGHLHLQVKHLSE